MSEAQECTAIVGGSKSSVGASQEGLELVSPSDDVAVEVSSGDRDLDIRLSVLSPELWLPSDLQ